MVRHVILFVAGLALLAGCENMAEYRPHAHEEGQKERVTALIPEIKDQPAKPLHSGDGSAKKRLLEPLTKDDQYLIVAGDVLRQVSEELNGRLLQINAILVWLSPDGEVGMSVFETRDCRFEFEVSWGKLDSWDNTEEIMRIKKRVHENHRESTFRLYGHLEHENSLFHTYRVLNIDKWKIVEW